jgi:peptidoglycan/LPS O-acetylase OafA/YrhL
MYELTQAWRHLPHALAGLILTVLLAWLLFALFERPLERLIRGEQHQ